MIQKTEVELEKANALKAYRTAIRLKHSLAADAEINETLPRVEAEFDKAVAESRPFRLLVGEVFKQ